MTNAKYDGKAVSVSGQGLTWDTVAIKRVNDNTLTEERTKQGGKYHTTVRTVVSPDGKTMTREMRYQEANGSSSTSTGMTGAERMIWSMFMDAPWQMPPRHRTGLAPDR